MKRRAISFITVLALCLSLCPMRALAAYDVNKTFTLTENMTDSVTYDVAIPLLFDARGYSYTISGHTAVSVKSTGRLYLTTGRIESTGGAGIEVQTGGRLYADKPDMTVVGTTYGLDIFSGAAAELSGGTFTGGTAAIRAEDYRALLASTGDTHYAYFDEGGNPIPLFDANGDAIPSTKMTVEKTVAVKECTDHVYSYKANTGAPTHDGTCMYCGAKIGPLPCTFDFDESGYGKCTAECGHTLSIDITINRNDLTYNGENRPPENGVAVEVTLYNGTDSSETLIRDTDYVVEYTPRVNADETVTVTVADITYRWDYQNYRWAYQKPFRIIRDTPAITWKSGSSVEKNYNADKAVLLSEIKSDLLSKVVITGSAGKSLTDELKHFLEFSYKKTGANDDSYTEGLPADAGTYQIIAGLPLQPNYDKAVSSDPITLTIRKISPFQNGDVPAAKNLTYNGAAQELVTPGTVWDGAEILFSLSGADGAWSTDIPTGINADKYTVYYKVEGSDNYDYTGAAGSLNVEIQRKKITPDVKLSYYTCVYDGGYKQPAVTVSDKDGWTVLPGAEYEVTYRDNRDVGTARVIVSDRDGGNYAIIPPEDQEVTPPEEGQKDPNGVVVTFKITPADQAGLTITNLPNKVVYGDVFTLGTSGGSGNGTVTWEITAVKDGFDVDVASDNFDEIATVDPASGQVTVTGVGTVTVRATKSGADNGTDNPNHANATAEWTFTAGKRAVAATVTAESRPYNGGTAATVHAVVGQGLAFSDTITITGLTGTFKSAGAGTGKTVTVAGSAVITLNGNTAITNNSGAKNEKYIVTIPETATANITKAATAVTAPTPETLTYDGNSHPLVSAAAASPTVDAVQVEYSLYADGPWSRNIPSGTGAGSYEVWYRVKESDNYLGTAAEKVVVTIKPRPVTSPVITLSQTSYVYDGSEKKPAVTAVKDGTVTIPASEYTVTYSNNVNVGTAATVMITDNAGGNYEVNGTITFAITEGQAVLTGTPQPHNLTYNGQEQDLVTVGTAAGGHLEYAWREGNLVPEDSDYSDEIPKGKDAGLYKVYYKVKGDGNHNGIETASIVYVTIQPKTVSSPVIQFVGEDGLPSDSYSAGYDKGEHKPSVIVKDGSVTIAGPDGENPEYTVSYSNNVDAGTATVHIIDNNGGNYTVNGSKTFTITKAKAGFAAGKEPQAKDLTYNGSAQPLVTPGEPVGGTAVYSLNGGAYSAEVPTGIAASGEYKVSAKVLGDKNHEDSDEVGPITVTIGKKTVTDPDIELSSTRFRYNGSEQKPTITVKDEKGNVIPVNEYKVTYTGSTVNVGSYTVRIESRNINYLFTFTNETKSTFGVTIVEANQETLTITGKPGVVYYGDTIQLSTEGGSGNGTVVWSIVAGENERIKKGLSDGQFEITGVGDITIKAVRTPAAGSGYAPIEDTWTFHAYEKPVTAVVMAANKVYDGNTIADLTVTVPGTALRVTAGVTGAFDNAAVGTDRIVTITEVSGGATVTGANSEKYAISFPATTTASITPATPVVTGVVKKTDTDNTNLKYTGEPQALVTAGSVNGVNSESGNAVGDVVYSLDGSSYGLSVPEGTGAGTYTVWYKAVAAAGGNYKDSAPKLLEVTIDPKTVKGTDLTVACSPEIFPYDGTQKTPYITVKDGEKVIPADEYIVTFESAARTEINTYKFTITARPGGNYRFTGDVTGEFDIVAAAQAPLSIVVSGSLNVCYGDTFQLSTVGGSGAGAVKWKVESNGTGIAEISEDGGVVTVKGTGSFTVTAYKEGTGSYGQSNADSVTFTAKPKQITPVITVDDKNYDKTDKAAVHVRWKSGDLVDGDSIMIRDLTDEEPAGRSSPADDGANKEVTITGRFSSPDVGTNKQVTVDVIFEGDEGKYEIVLPALITGSIYRVDAKLDPEKVPQAQEDLVYDGSSQALLVAGDTVGSIGTVEYSLSEKGSYSTVIPTGMNAGTYTVWYRVAESVNWTGIGPVSVEVTIAPKVVNNPKITCTLTDGEPVITVTDGAGNEIPAGEYEYSAGKIEGSTFYTVTVTVKARPGGNYSFGPVTETFTIEKSETPGASGNTGSGDNTGGSTSGTGSSGSLNAPATTGSNAESASMQTSVRDGTASTVINAAAGDELVNEAVANRSEAIVIKPEITGDVTKTEVSIPGSVVSRLGSETNAALTVSTPVADVTIPNTALDMLSDAGDTVSIVTERVENTVMLTLDADGREIGDIPGGLTLTVPMEDAGPGTVAVLIHEDGTREIVRRSVAENGAVRIPLNGSGTVEIVDNSKEFEDVSAESWAADAVAFASAHELFNGTGETTFSPEMTMSRAMLVTVLYNLAGCPDQSLTDEFSDIDSDAWYAAGVSWAAANGITYGYGNGQFGPNDNLTREQLAVMLWRYVGNSAADERVLNFTDADQASGYAMEALYWAIANKILNGYGDGHLDPSGMATRAQAAQMLKNFIENT